MPIYEYLAVEPRSGCERCRRPFEVMQGIYEEPLAACPSCGAAVCRRISLVRVLIPGAAAGRDPVEQQVAEYERQGMWSHAAELADKESEKPERAHLKERAMEDYRRAGYDV
jgi:putative FmdB family regulatory protein